MANIKSAVKRARQSEIRRSRNVGQRSALRTFVKKALQAVIAGDKPTATTAFREAESTLDTFARKDLIHKNKASRLKSRLAAKLKAMT